MGNVITHSAAVATSGNSAAYAHLWNTDIRGAGTGFAQLVKLDSAAPVKKLYDFWFPFTQGVGHQRRQGGWRPYRSCGGQGSGAERCEASQPKREDRSIRTGETPPHRLTIEPSLTARLKSSVACSDHAGCTAEA